MAADARPPLHGRKALVTGGGAGIGAAIATALAAAGATVRTVDVRDGPEVDYVTDVSDDAAVAAMFEHLDEGLGGLDILVNNVGVAGATGLVEELDPEDFDRCLKVNVGGTFRVTRHAVPRLRESRSGCVVNISSTAGHLAYPLRSPYAASKWAVEGLTRTWAAELGPSGIRVNCVAPGTVAGERMDRVMAAEATASGVSVEAVRSGYLEQISMRTFMEPADIAAMVVFLCSDGARFVNGQVVGVDGYTETLRTVYDRWPASHRRR